MLEFRDVFAMCMLFVHVSRGYVDLPAELPPHMGPPPSGNNDSLYLKCKTNNPCQCKFRNFREKGLDIDETGNTRVWCMMSVSGGVISLFREGLISAKLRVREVSRK